MLADVRDSMFQKDPFAEFTTGFFAFHGVESRTIKDCGWNGGWVYGSEVSPLTSELSATLFQLSDYQMVEFARAI